MMWMLTFWDVIAINLHVLETQHIARCWTHGRCRGEFAISYPNCVACLRVWVFVCMDEIMTYHTQNIICTYVFFYPHPRALSLCANWFPWAENYWPKFSIIYDILIHNFRHSFDEISVQCTLHFERLHEYVNTLISN